MKPSIVQVAAFVRSQKETSQSVIHLSVVYQFKQIEVVLQRREKTHTTGIYCFGSALLCVMKPFSFFVLAVLDNTHFQRVAVG